MAEDSNKVVVEVPEDMNDLVPEFLQNRRSEVERIYAALESGDFKTIRIFGHNMAGCGVGYGFPEITNIGRSLESSALASDADSVRNAATKLKSYLNSVKVVYC